MLEKHQEKLANRRRTLNDEISVYLSESFIFISVFPSS